MEDVSNDWFGEDTATFGDRVAGGREAAGLSQEDLAKKLGVKLSTLSNWENDLNEPRANKLQMLAGVLGVSMRWLLTGEGEGLEEPLEHQEMPDVSRILMEMRQLRTQMVQAGEKLGKLEKQLRQRLGTGV